MDDSRAAFQKCFSNVIISLNNLIEEVNNYNSKGAATYETETPYHILKLFINCYDL